MRKRKDRVTDGKKAPFQELYEGSPPPLSGVKPKAFLPINSKVQEYNATLDDKVAVATTVAVTNGIITVDSRDSLARKHWMGSFPRP